MKKALITGANGFLGAHLARKLASEGVPARALVRPGADLSNLEGLTVELVRGDLRDEGSLRRALAGVQWLFHAAADYRLHGVEPAAMTATNVYGTRRLLELAGEAGLERIVYTSTVATVAPRPDGRPADETSHYPGSDGIVSLYKRTKHEAEREALRLAARGLPIVVVNPSAPVGPYDRKPTPTGRIVLDFLNGRMPAYLETGLNVVAASDVAEGHWLALQRGRPGQRYILGGDNMTLKEILDVLSEATGIPAPRLKIPYAAAWTLAWLDTNLFSWGGREPRAPLDGVRMARRPMFFDASKAERELGYRHAPARRALEEAARWYVDAGRVLRDVPRMPRAAALAA